MMSHRILPAALLLCALTAACGELPTGSDAQAHPAGASYDGGGFTIGSGNAGAAGGSGTGSESEESTTSSDSEGRSGYTMGSGG